MLGRLTGKPVIETIGVDPNDPQRQPRRRRAGDPRRGAGIRAPEPNPIPPHDALPGVEAAERTPVAAQLPFESGGFGAAGGATGRPDASVEVAALTTGATPLAEQSSPSLASGTAAAGASWAQSVLLPLGAFAIAARAHSLSDSARDPAPQPQSITTRSIATLQSVRASSPGLSGSSAQQATDGDPTTAYIHADKSGGLIFVFSESTRATSLRLTSASRQPERDPIRVSLFGSDQELAWNAPEWLALRSNDLPSAVEMPTGLGLARGASSTIVFDNDTTYRFYKLVFDAVRNPSNADAVQIGEASLGTQADAIVIDYDIALSTTGIPEVSAFRVVQAGQTLAVQALSVKDDKVTLSVPDLKPLQFTLSYTDRSASDDVQTLQSATGVDAGSFVRGVASDGYISGGRVILDDGDGVFLPGADLDTGIRTAADGSFLLNADQLALLESGRSLLLTGGTNTDTRLPNLLALTAPPGAMVINPLTTVAQAMIHTGSARDLAEASSKIARALELSLPPGGLAAFDPLAMAGASAHNPGAIVAQRTAVLLATFLTLASESAGSEQQTVQRGLVEAIVRKIDAIRSSADPTLDLANPGTLTELGTLAQQSLAHQGVRAPESIGLANDASVAADIAAKIAALTGVATLEELSSAQQISLDVYPPAAPVIKSLVPDLRGGPSTLVMTIDVGSDSTSRIKAGDSLTISGKDGLLRHQVTLSEDQLTSGQIQIDLPAGTSLSQIDIGITDIAGNHSKPASTIPALKAGDAPQSFSIDFGAQFLPLFQWATDSISNIEIPLAGNLGTLLSADKLLVPLRQHLLDLPELIFIRKAASATPLEALSVGSSNGSMTTDQVMSTSGSDSRTDGFYFGEFEIVNPPEPTTPEPTTPEPTTPSTPAPVPAADPLTPAAYKHTGAQSQPADVWDWDIDLSTNTFELFFTQSFGPEDWEGLSLPIGIEAGDNLINFHADANLGGYVTVSGALRGGFGKELWDPIYLDTGNSRFQTYFNVGLSPGSTLSGTLGPLTLSGTDQNSAYASSTALRKNTGLEGGFTLGLKDGLDGVANDNRLYVSGATGKVVGSVMAAPLSLETYKKLIADTFSVAGFLEGRLSAEVKATFSAGETLRALFDGEVGDTLAMVADLLNLSLAADLAVPFRIAGNTEDASVWKKQTFANLRLDDIRVGVGSVISDLSGAAIEIIDQVMTPLYAIENLLNTPVAIPQSVIPPFRIDLGRPDINQVADFFLGESIGLLNDAFTGLVGAFDSNQDNKVSAIEGFKSALTYYYKTITITKAIWDAIMQVAPGAKEALTASGYGNFVIALAESIEAQKMVVQTAIQVVGVIEKAFQIIDKIERVGDSYDALKATLDEGQLKLLEIPFGSLKWDILNGTFSSEFDPLSPSDWGQSLLEAAPPWFSPEPGLSRDAARSRLLTAITEAKVQDLVQGGQLHEYVYLFAGVEGVGPGNLDAINSLIGSAGIREWLSRPQKSSAGYTEPESAQSNDPTTRMLGKLDQVVAAYERIRRVATGSHAQADATLLNEAFQALEIVGRSNVETESFRATHYSDKARALLRSIVTGVGPFEVDSVEELQGLWQGFVSWNTIASDPASTATLTKTQLDAIELRLLDKRSGPGSDLERINQAIKAYKGDPADAYGTIKRQATALNQAWFNTDSRQLETDQADSVQASRASALLSISRDAESDRARQYLTRKSFADAGIDIALDDAQFASFLGYLDTKAITGELTDTDAELRGLIAAYSRVVSVADGKTIKPSDFYQAIELLFPKGNAPLSRAAELEYIPFYNSATRITDSSKRTPEQPSLPLLQSLIASSPATSIDDPEELDRFISLTKKVLELNLYDQRLWSKADAQKFQYLSNYWDRFESRADKYSGAVPDSAMLTTEELKILGLGSISPTELLTRLRQYNTDFRPYGRDKLDVESRLNDGYSFNSLSKAFTDSSLPNASRLRDFLPASKPLLVEDLLTSMRTGEQQFEASLANIPALQDLFRAMRDVGIEFPLFSEAQTLRKLIEGKVFDLIRFTLPVDGFGDEFKYEWDLGNVMPSAFKTAGFTLPLNATLDYHIDPNLTIGLDSTFLNRLAAELIVKKLGGTPPENADHWLKTLFDSVFMLDRHEVDGVMMDAPELAGDVSLTLGADIGWGKKTGLIFGGVGVAMGAGLGFEVDINTDDPDGKLRFGEVVDRAISNPASILDIFGIDIDLNLLFKAGLRAQLLTDPPDGIPSDSPPWLLPLLTVYNGLVESGLVQWFDGSPLPTEFIWNPTHTEAISLASLDWNNRLMTLIGGVEVPFFS